MNLTLWFTLSQFLIESNKSAPNTQKFLSFITEVQNEVNYQTILHVESQQSESLTYLSTENLMAKFGASYIPLIKTDLQNEVPISTKVNRNLLVLLVLEPELETAQKQLKTLWLKLTHLGETKTILMFHGNTEFSTIRSVLAYCAENKAPDTIAINENSLQSQTYYAIRLFPAFQVSLKSFSEQFSKIFPNQVANMHGHPIRVVRNEMSMISYFYIDNRGQKVYSGLMGRFITTFAEKHNATLIFPSTNKPQRSLSRDEAMSLIQDNSHDMSASAASLQQPNASFSNIYGLIDGCFMVPVEKSLPNYLYYIMVYDWPSMLMFLMVFIMLVILFKFMDPHFSILYIFNGCLGQAFHKPQSLRGLKLFFSLIICFTGVIFNALYAGTISSYETSPPTEAPMTTLAQIKAKGLKLFIVENEWFNDLKNKSQEIPVIVMKNYDEYFATRDSLDTRYIYSITSWPYAVFHEQQKFFTKPIFRFSDICFRRNLFVGFPLQKNSLYLKSVNTLIGQVHQSGLLEKWKSQGFFELWHIRRVNLNDRGEKHHAEPLNLEDLSLVFGFFIAALASSVLCFLLEMLAFKFFKHQVKC